MNKTYDEGLRDGKIFQLEETQENHGKRLDSHSRRLNKIEKLIYIGLGGLIVLQAFPAISKFVGGITG